MSACALVLEDSATQMRIVSTLLTRASWGVMQAADVPTALRIVEKTPVALMLLDVYVGTDSSLAYLDEFRKAAPRTPIAIMTAGRAGRHTVADTIAAARRAKVEYLLPKPFCNTELERILAEAGKAAIRERAQRILVVDDSATIRALVRRHLEAENYIVYEAPTMENAIDRIEPPRVCRRLHSLRGWSHEQEAEDPAEVFAGGA